MTRPKGRSLTEVVLAIIMLVITDATAAEPSSHEAREFIESAIDATAMHRIVATETMLSSGVSPSSFEEMGLTAEQVKIDEGDLAWRHDRWILTFAAAAPAPLPGTVLIFKPIVRNAGRVEWVCGFQEPKSDGSQSNGSESTTVPREFLPASCK